MENSHDHYYTGLLKKCAIISLCNVYKSKYTQSKTNQINFSSFQSIFTFFVGYLPYPILFRWQPTHRTERGEYGLQNPVHP